MEESRSQRNNGSEKFYRSVPIRLYEIFIYITEGKKEVRKEGR